MQPLKLTLEGFRGIKDGMGLDRYHLDLEGELGDAVLVALVGPNGRGKTTILDNLHPYRVMPSKLDRSTNYSPDAFTFYDHLVGPGKASKELEWQHQGTRYRSAFYWKVTEKTAKTEAYLFRWGGAGLDPNSSGWQPVTLPDGTTSDGKAKTYDACVEGVLGSPRLFFTAAFSAQGRTQLSSYTHGDIKALMGEVLGLDAIQELGDKAGEVAKALRQELAGVRDQLQNMEQHRQKAETTRENISSNKASLGMRDEAVRQARQRVDECSREAQQVERNQQDQEASRQKRAELEGQLQENSRNCDADMQQIAADLNAESDRQKAAAKAADEGIQQLRNQVEKQDRAIQEADQVLAQRDRIQEAQRDLPRLREAEQTAAAAVETAREKAQKAQEARAQLQSMEQHLQSLTEAGKRASQYRDELQSRCALIDQVPCKGTDLQPRCQLLAEANQAADKLPEAEQELAEKQRQYREQNEQRQSLVQQVEELRGLEQALEQAKGDHQRAQSAVQDAERVAARADELDRAEANRSAAVQEKDQLEQKIANALDRREQEQHEIGQRIQELTDRTEYTRQRYQEADDRIRAELEKLPQPGDDQALNAARQRLEQAQQQQQEAEAEAEKLRGTIAHLEGQLQGLQETLQRVNELESQAESLEDEAAHWVTLQQALGRDGILALAIDDAGPTLSSLTNDLLLTCYGPRFTVRIDTQTQTKTGDTRETFDVTVLDADTDEAKSVRDMSGGERIWINEALTRSIALYQAQQSGQAYATLFSDEADGALDHDRKQQFLAMKRRVLELGGYGREIFISHTPDLWGMADHVIDLGGSEHGSNESH